MLWTLLKHPTHKLIALILTLWALIVWGYYLRPESVTQAQHQECQEFYEQLANQRGEIPADESEVIYSARTDSCLIGTTFTRPSTNEYYVRAFDLEADELLFMYKEQPLGFYLDDNQQKVKCDEMYYYLEQIDGDELNRTFWCEKEELEQRMQRQMQRYGFTLVE